MSHKVRNLKSMREMDGRTVDFTVTEFPDGKPGGKETLVIRFKDNTQIILVSNSEIKCEQ